MTSLEKVIQRRTREHYPYGKGSKLTPLIVALEPGDLITVREQGRRQSSKVSIDAGDLYRMLLMMRARAQQAERQQARKAKKQLIKRGKV